MTIANMRQWLATAKPTWTLPLARPEVEQIVAERAVLVAALRSISRKSVVTEMHELALATLAAVGEA